MTKFYTYIYRDPSKSLEAFYVGKGKNSRAYVHLKRTDKHPLVHRIKRMKSDGIEPIIEIIEALDEDHALFLEKCLIDIFGRKDIGTGTLLNLTDGGDGLANPSITTRKKMSQNQKDRMANNPKIKDNLCRTGKKHKDETKEKMRMAKKNMPEESKDRLRTLRCGKSHSENTKRKMKDSQRAKAVNVGTIWVNDGVNSKRIRASELNNMPGWHKGRKQ